MSIQFISNNIFLFYFIFKKKTQNHMRNDQISIIYHFYNFAFYFLYFIKLCPCFVGLSVLQKDITHSDDHKLGNRLSNQLATHIFRNLLIFNRQIYKNTKKFYEYSVTLFCVNIIYERFSTKQKIKLTQNQKFLPIIPMQTES